MAVQRIARDYGGSRVLLFGSPSLKREAESAGLKLVQDAADVILLGRDEAFTYEKLALAANEVRRGATLVAANPDTSHPGAGGRLVPETGTLMRAIVTCAGPATVHVIGKPQPDLFLEGLCRLGATPSTSIVIGDNRDTDVAGAARLGMRHILVGSGPDCDVTDLNQLIKEFSAGSPTFNSLSPSVA